MSLFGRLIPNVVSNVRNGLLGVNLVTSSAPVAETAGGLFTTSIRTMIRCHFPRPSERKRVKRHGWKKRLSTEGGRAVLMRRILKGRHVYSH